VAQGGRRGRRLGDYNVQENSSESSLTPAIQYAFWVEGRGRGNLLTGARPGWETAYFLVRVHHSNKTISPNRS
jgi:hypothetical protein